MIKWWDGCSSWSTGHLTSLWFEHLKLFCILKEKFYSPTFTLWQPLIHVKMVIIYFSLFLSLSILFSDVLEQYILLIFLLDNLIGTGIIWTYKVHVKIYVLPWNMLLKTASKNQYWNSNGDRDNKWEAAFLNNNIH